MYASTKRWAWSLLAGWFFLVARASHAAEPRLDAGLIQAPAGQSELALAMRVTTTPPTLAILLGLNVPLDRWGPPAALAIAPGPTWLAGEALRAATTTSAASSPVTLLARIDSRWVQKLIHVAWSVARVPEGDPEVSSLRTRARVSALLPETRLRLLRTDDARAALDVDPETGALRGTQQVGYTWEGRLAWRLDRLLFAEEELGAMRIQNEHRDARDRITKRVLDAYFQYRRANVDLETADLGSRESWEARLKVDESIATLDALTGGYFSEHGPAERAPRRDP